MDADASVVRGGSYVQHRTLSPGIRMQFNYNNIHNSITVIITVTVTITATVTVKVTVTVTL